MKKYIFFIFYFLIIQNLFAAIGTNIFIDKNGKSNILVGDVVNSVNGQTGDISLSTSSIVGYELLANKSTNTSLGTSDTLYPSQNAVKSYIDTSTTTLNSIKEDKLYASAAEIWVDGTRTDSYVENGTVARPYKNLHDAVAIITTTTCIHIAPATYTETDDLTLPNVPIVIYGNGATIISTNTITINNPNFVRYNLFTTAANVVYNNFATGARCLVQGGGITGNITVNSYVEFTQCQLNGGTITVGATGQCVCSLFSPTSKFVSAGILTMERINMNTNYAGYLITSTAGQLTLVNCIIYNGSNNALAGAVSCNNGATTVPNLVSNNFFTTLGSSYGLYAGTAYTVYSKNYVVATNTVIGTHLLPVNTDIMGGGTVMGLGSDATGDIYYRNSSALLTRLGIGTSTTTIRGGTIPVYDSIPNILGYTPVNKAGDTMTGDLIINSAGDGTINLCTVAGSTQTIITANGVSVFGGGNVLVGTTTIALATSGLTVYEKDIRISTGTTSGSGIYFQDNSFQTRAYAPVFVSSQNVNSAINIASTSDVYISTITLTQIGGKNIGVIGAVEFTSDAAKTHTISLYRGATLLQSWVHNIMAGDDISLPIMWFSDMASTAGAVVYTIRVHSSAATGTQTVANYNWRVRED